MKNLLRNAPDLSFRRLFAEAVQDDPGRKDGGYVRLEFVDDDRRILRGRIVKGRKKRF